MTRRSSAAAIALAAVLAAGCVPGTPDADPFEGRWRSEGYGMYLDVSGGIDVYEHTSVSCGLVAGGTGRGSAEILRLEEGRLLLTEGGRTIAFDPVEVLPERCSEPFRSDDPADTFAVMVATMTEHYAAFGLRAPEWPDEAAAALAALPSGLDDAGLLAEMQALLGPLGDAQVRLAGPGPDLLPGGVWSAETLPPHVADLAARVRAGEVPGVADPQVALDGAVVWGVLPGGQGYLAVTRLAGFADVPEVEERLLADAIDRALGALADVSGLVFDLRTDRGGREGLAMLVASRFVAEETLVAAREVRVGGTEEYADGGDLVARPLPGGPFPRPVAVLVGPGTAGAAEVLVLALREAGAVLVGAPTAGSLSPLLIRELPNGWNLGLGHQRVLDPDGVWWEGGGIPVDVPVEEVATVERDPVVEAAATVLR